MANTITRQVLHDSPRDYIVKFCIIGDGSGDETNTRVNATSGDMGTSNKIVAVHAELSGMNARLLFDATSKVFAVALSQYPGGMRDYRSFGGVVNNAGAGVTGDILITTSGLGATGFGSIILHVMRNN